VSVQYQPSGRTALEISASVEAGVREARLPAGAMLPPVRTLAQHLGVSPATVAAAYRALRQRGVIETAGRNGTRVRPRPAVAGARSALRLPVPEGVRDLVAGEPDPLLLPPLAPLLHRLAAATREPTGYREAGALPELVGLARDRLAADGVPVTDAEITVTGGALDGIERLLTAHLRPGDRIAVEDPGWANLLDLVAALGLEPVPVPMDDDGPTESGLRAALAAGARGVVVTTRAQNPTGAALSRDRAAALRGVLRGAADVLVIEDDHAAELAPVPLHPLAGATPHWAFLRSVSKPYGPDLRLAVLAGDAATVARVVGRMRLGAGWVSTLLQRLVVEVWRDEEVAGRVRHAATTYAARRGALRDALRARGLPARGRTGINVWLPVADETAVLGRLREEGYAVAPGSLYRLHSAPGIRMTASDLSVAEVPAVAEAVARAVNGAPRGPLSA
jgi:DNA-binding transcriptional MocR family regulator